MYDSYDQYLKSTQRQNTIMDAIDENAKMKLQELRETWKGEQECDCTDCNNDDTYFDNSADFEINL